MLLSFHTPQDRSDSFFNCHHIKDLIRDLIRDPIRDLISVCSSEAEADLIKAGRVILDKGFLAENSTYVLLF